MALRKLFLVVGLVAAGFIADTASAQIVLTPAAHPAAKTTKVATTQIHGRVFLLRGLANVFSLGMDKLARKLRAEGMPAQVSNYSNWRSLADTVVEEQDSGESVEPIILIGHSLGADAAVNMGNYLAREGVPVRLIVAFDGVAESGPVIDGIAEVINYYKGDSLGSPIKGAPGFDGKLTNLDVSNKLFINHLTIEKSNRLQSEVISKVSSIFGER